MANNFWFKFYFKEWADDVKPLSLSARGLLIELIIHLRKCSGEMSVNPILISRLTGSTTEEINFGLQEFRDHGIFDFEKTPDGEILRSRKIIKELHRSLVNKENGDKGGNPNLKKSVKRTKKKSVNQKPNRTSDSDFNSDSIFISLNKEKGFVFDFLDERFKQPFQDWLEYKKSRKEMYSTQKSIEASYKTMINLASSDPQKAVQVVEFATGNNYQGMVPVKNFNATQNGKQQKYAANQAGLDQLEGIADNHLNGTVNTEG